MVKYKHIVFVLLILLPGCQKEDEPLTGMITGRMTIYDQYHKSLSDRSGITVNLFQETDVIGSTITDPRGAYKFENIPYGKYKIELKKDKYIQAWTPPVIYHVGGYSPSFASSSVFEIPTYQLSLDSVGYYSPDNRFLIFLKIDGDTVLSGTETYSRFILFAGNTPEVSRDNFISMGKGYLSDWEWTTYQHLKKVTLHGMLEMYDNFGSIEEFKSGSIYIRIYPLANGQGYGVDQFFPEALGKPSNVISFVWKDLVGSN
jgi:hypothetical protein